MINDDVEKVSRPKLKRFVEPSGVITVARTTGKILIWSRSKSGRLPASLKLAQLRMTLRLKSMTSSDVKSS